jgi:hypothetical protein
MQIMNRIRNLDSIDTSKLGLAHAAKDCMYGLVTGKRSDYPEPPASWDLELEPVYKVYDRARLEYDEKFVALRIDRCHLDARVLVRAKGYGNNQLVSINGHLVIVPEAHVKTTFEGWNQAPDPPNDIQINNFNPDIPDPLHNYMNGQSNRVNDHLDPEKGEIMNKDDRRKGDYICNSFNRDFRDICVQRDGKNHFLYLKGPQQMGPPNHLNPDWLQKTLTVSFEQATRLATALADLEKGGLSINHGVAMKLFYGNVEGWDDNKKRKLNVPLKLDLVKRDEKISRKGRRRSIEYRATNLPKGLINISDTAKENAIGYLETLAESLAEVTVKSEDFVQFDETILYGLDKSKSAPYDEGEDENLYLSTDGEQIQADFDTSSANPFTTRPMFFGNESLPDEIFYSLVYASRNELSELCKGMFKQLSPRTGKLVSKKYWWFTKSQENQFWEIWSTKKAQFDQPTEKIPVTEDMALVIDWITSLKKCLESQALIGAFAENRKVYLYGTEFNFKAKPTQAQVAFVWSKYRAL